MRKETHILPLGRWNLDNVSRKIDQANHDHCGQCGNNLLKKRKENKSVIVITHSKKVR